MPTTWILVANASRATIYANEGPNKGLRKVKEASHEASRAKGSELVSDRPGHDRAHGNGHGSYVPAKDPKEIEAERFALELARELDAGRVRNAYGRLIMAASPHFMGLLNRHLDPHVRQLVSDSIEKDYTRATEKELAGHLASCMFL